MSAFYSLFFVLALVLAVVFGVGSMHMAAAFGIWVPYIAVLIFLAGFVLKVFNWARSPVPFSIPTTAGQQKTLDWIKPNCIDNPSSKGATWVRMALEVLLFRSLFRNTRTQLFNKESDDPVVAYASTKWLWLFALIFHYSFLIIIIRHMRLFTEPIPGFVTITDTMDSLFQIGAPTLYFTDLGIVIGASFLLLRRFVQHQVRYISLAADYFPLFLILSIAFSGVYMRYFAKVDVVAIKELTMGLVTLSPVIPENISLAFYVHFFLVCVLLAYFPFSKLMHAGGVFMSPTRNLPNDTRMKHYENPWNPRIPPHSYEAYEDDFREPMIEAGLPVVKKG